MKILSLNDDDYDKDDDDDDDDDLHARYLVECLWRRPGHLGAQAGRQLLHV